MHRDLEEIRELSKKQDLYFSSLLFESDHINKILDAYCGSLPFLDQKQTKTNRYITDKTNEKVFGVDGKLHYAHQHFTIVSNLLNCLFTPSHEIWLKYNPDDPVWSGERDKAISIIRQNLVNDFIPRTTMIIKGCQDAELQQKEM